jgi:hypothetical protein
MQRRMPPVASARKEREKTPDPGKHVGRHGAIYTKPIGGGATGSGPGAGRFFRRAGYRIGSATM